MMLTVDGHVRTGRVIDARPLPVDADAVVAAVRGESAPPDVAIEAPAPGPLHERIGHVHPGMGLRVRTALAEAGRTRGLSAPEDEALAEARERLASLDIPDDAGASLGGTAPETGADVDALREEVATLRGRVGALRERDADPGETEAALRRAVTRLSEVETERVADRQRRDAARSRLRDARDVHERRLELEDEIANLERAARASLVDRLADEYRRAVAEAPGPTPQDHFAADAVTAAFAVGRVAAVDGPVVLTADRFPAPAAAADWFEAPVVKL
ncbi:MAG: hypothetical protein ABEJ30_04665 [Halorientalis sp.]